MWPQNFIFFCCIILTRDKRRHSSTNYDVFMTSLLTHCLKNKYVNDSTLLKI